MFRKINLEEINKSIVVSKPLSPGEWVNSTPTYREMTRLRMTCGGGMGGSSWYELIDRIDLTNLANLAQKGYMVVRNWLGKDIVINPNYMVKAEQVTLATAQFDNQNTNFEIGIREYNWIIEDGETVTLNPKY